jgi:hypothetical protein
MAAPAGVSFVPRRDLECQLKGLNLICQWWLRHAQALGGTAKMLLLGDGEKQPQMADKTKINHGLVIRKGYLNVY